MSIVIDRILNLIKGADLSESTYKGTLLNAAATLAAGGANGVAVLDSNGHASALLSTPTNATTARSFASQFANRRNVLDFSAVADGSTDDAAAINTAITAAVASGARIVYLPDVPAGYAVGSPIQIPSNIILVGDNVKGGQSSRIKPISGYTGALLQSAGYGTAMIQQSGIIGLCFDGSATTNTAVQLNCQELITTDCTFQNMWTYGMHFGGLSSAALAANNVVRDSYFTNVTGGGSFYDCILEDYYSSDTKLYHNYVQGATNSCVHSRGANLMMLGNHLYDAVYGVYFEDANERTLVANYIENMTKNGIYVSSGSSSELNLILIALANEFRNINKGATVNGVIELAGSYLDTVNIIGNILKRDSGTTYQVPYMFYGPTGTTNANVDNNIGIGGTLSAGESNMLPPHWGTDSGTAGAFVITRSVPIQALTVGTKISFFVNAGPNTGNCTINDSGLGAKPLVTQDLAQFAASALTAGALVTAVWNGTEYVAEGR